MRVLFWGTPEFATPPLRALIGEGFDVVAAVTRSDKPVGRSRSTTHTSPVKQVALAEGIPILQPERPRGDAFISELAAIKPDISVVVAYGHILPQEAIVLPRLGTVNIHGSLLPKLRGAAPIQAAIRGGLAETGVTIMRMVQALDAGPIILKARTPIFEDETYGELALRLSELGALSLIESLSLMELGHLPEELQNEGDATYAPKVDREITRLDWTRDSAAVCRSIRAYDPRPGALTTLRAAEVKLFGGRPVALAADVDRSPGEVVSIGEEGMVVACGGDAVRVAAIQPAGKRRMTPSELARGRGVAVGDRLGNAAEL